MRKGKSVLEPNNTPTTNSSNCNCQMNLKGNTLSNVINLPNLNTCGMTPTNILTGITAQISTNNAKYNIENNNTNQPPLSPNRASLTKNQKIDFSPTRKNDERLKEVSI